MLTRNTPLKRNPMKRARKKPVPAIEKSHMDYVASLPCLVSGASPVTLHHATGSIYGGRVARSHRCIVPLAARYHLIQHGPRESVEALGHRGFYERYGIDLAAEGHRIWRESPANPERALSA